MSGAARTLAVALAVVPAMHVLAPPSPVAGTDKQRHLVYEIQVENDTGARMRLDALEVAAAAGGVPIAAYRGPAIARLLSRIERPDRPARLLAPGRTGVLFMDIGVPQARR